jgi:hypothetical protein
MELVYYRGIQKIHFEFSNVKLNRQALLIVRERKLDILSILIANYVKCYKWAPYGYSY